MKKIYLGGKSGAGKFALIDDEDEIKLSSSSWSYHCGYARARRNMERVFMHNVILGITPKGKMPDHIDGNKLNNQKSNLRFCTHQENIRNRTKPNTNTSGYKGVCKGYTKVNGCSVWVAQIELLVNGKRKGLHLGCFTDKVEAAMAYDFAAIKHHGEFANLNFK